MDGPTPLAHWLTATLYAQHGESAAGLVAQARQWSWRRASPDRARILAQVAHALDAGRAGRGGFVDQQV